MLAKHFTNYFCLGLIFEKLFWTNMIWYGCTLSSMEHTNKLSSLEWRRCLLYLLKQHFWMKTMYFGPTIPPTGGAVVRLRYSDDFIYRELIIVIPRLGGHYKKGNKHEVLKYYFSALCVSYVSTVSLPQPRIDAYVLQLSACTAHSYPSRCYHGYYVIQSYS